MWLHVYYIHVFAIFCSCYNIILHRCMHMYIVYMHIFKLPTLSGSCSCIYCITFWLWLFLSLLLLSLSPLLACRLPPLSPSPAVLLGHLHPPIYTNYTYTCRYTNCTSVRTLSIMCSCRSWRYIYKAFYMYFCHNTYLNSVIQLFYMYMYACVSLCAWNNKQICCKCMRPHTGKINSILFLAVALWYSIYMYM